MTIDEALERFLVQLAADGRSEHTIAQYRRHIRTLSRWVRDVRPRRDRVLAAARNSVFLAFSA
ncbi:MAG: hypothetical protein ACRD2T_01630 [Thermoanaerobaculia bacterium]